MTVLEINPSWRDVGGFLVSFCCTRSVILSITIIYKAQYIKAFIQSAFFLEWWQQDLYNFESNRKKVKGHVLKHEVTFLSARPLLFHPCLTLLLSLSRMLSWAAGRASGVYSSYCMTYTWRVCSLFIFWSPTAWAQLFAVCTISATVSFITFSSPGSHTYSHCIHSDLGASGNTAKVERTDKAGPFVLLPLTPCNFYLCKWISYDINSIFF